MYGDLYSILANVDQFEMIHKYRNGNRNMDLLSLLLKLKPCKNHNHTTSFTSRTIFSFGGNQIKKKKIKKKKINK